MSVDTGSVPSMTYGTHPTRCLNNSEPPIKDVAKCLLRSQKEAKRDRLGGGADQRSGGNSPTPQLRSGAHDQEASSR